MRAKGHGGSLRKEKRGSRVVYVADYYDGAGTRRKKTLGSDRKVAEAAFRQLLRHRDLEREGVIDLAGQHRSVDEVVEAYLADLSRRNSGRYAEQTRQQIQRVLGHLGNITIRNLRAQHLLDYRAVRANEVGRNRKTPSNRTLNAEVDAFKRALRWASRAGVIGASPVDDLQRLPQREADLRKRRRALSDDEVRRFLAAAEGEDERRRAIGRGAVPQRALWHFLIERGPRWTETIELTWADVDFEQRRITFRPETTKARRAKVVPISEAFSGQLRACVPSLL